MSKVSRNLSSLLAAIPLAVATGSVASAQNAFPTVDIYIAELKGAGCPCAPVNVTHRAGYDNQPRFLPDGKSLLYTADDDSGGTNIYRLDLASGRGERITQTPESEFSPTLMPDGRQVSVVRIDPDLSQHLWSFPLPRRARDVPVRNYSFRKLIPAVEPVGYHVWIDSHTLVLFVLGEPNSLYVADSVSGAARKIIGPIGRSLHRIPGTALASFMDLRDEKNARISSFDPATGEIREIARPLRPGDVDYAWTPDGRLVMSQEGRLLAWDPKTSGPWLPFADFTSASLQNITRMAFSADGSRLALVAADGK